jgi:hypothetical protein
LERVPSQSPSLIRKVPSKIEEPPIPPSATSSATKALHIRQRTRDSPEDRNGGRGSSPDGRRSRAQVRDGSEPQARERERGPSGSGREWDEEARDEDDSGEKEPRLWRFK